MSKSLQKYFAIKGNTYAAVARALSVDKSTVKRWSDGDVPVPTKRLIEIEAVTGLSRQELRPDLYDGYEPAQKAGAL